MTREEEIALRDDISRLKRRVSILERAASAHSWDTNPDRSGGAFTEQEIRDSTAWK